MNGNGESWTENKEQKRFCEIIKYLKTSPVRVRVAPSDSWAALHRQPKCQLWLLCSLFATTAFGVWISFSFPPPLSLFVLTPPPFPTPQLPELEDKHFVSFANWTKYNEGCSLGSAAGCSGHWTAGELVFHCAVPEVQRKDTARTQEHPSQHYSRAHRWPGRGAGWDLRFFTCQSFLIQMVSRACCIRGAQPAFGWLVLCWLGLTVIWLTQCIRTDHKLLELSQHYFSGLMILKWIFLKGSKDKKMGDEWAWEVTEVKGLAKSMVVHSCNLSAWKVERREPGVQGRSY